MKTNLPVRRAISRTIGTLAILLLVQGFAFSQATALLKFGNSYVNLSKRAVGGPVEPGDTLEIRVNFYLNKNYNGSGNIYRVRYYDNLPTHTSILPGSTLDLITNEGIVLNSYTQAPNDDPGTFSLTQAIPSDYQIRINMGGVGGLNPTYPTGVDPMGIGNNAGATNLQGGNSRPLFSSGSIITTAFRVVVDPASNYGDTITLGAGKVAFKKTSNGADTILNAIQYKILVQKPTTLCTSSTSTNFAAESGGTFGHGVGLNRAAAPTYLIPGYTYLPSSGTSTTINDGYYAIVNNVSPTSSTFANARRTPNCNVPSSLPNSDPSSCYNREFGGYWYINGDHTGTSNAAGNNPPSASTDAGYMLLVNADLATSEAYRQTIGGLCPNTYYQFSVWVKNVCPTCGIDKDGNATYKPGVLPNLTLVIDGIDRISTGQLDTVGWQQRGFVFLTGPSQNTITISIRNNASGGGGNDWAMDDITLATCPPTLALTPNKPDTLCQGADDTVRFKVSAFVDNYTEWMLQKSTDGGSTWAATGNDTLGRADHGSMAPTVDPSTGLYTDLVTRYYRLQATDNLVIYRLIVASTTNNLTTTGCYYITNQPKIVRGVDCMIVLPTTLLSFRGQVREGLGNLQWVSENEVNGLVYTVERSDDGVSYKPLISLPGVAGEGRGASYQFSDPNPITSQTYYRISLSSAGSKRYSSLVLLSSGKIQFEVRSALNPFIDHITVDLTTPSEGKVVLTLVDMYGRIVRRLQQTVGQGLNNLNVYGLGGLPAGTYALQIQMNDQVISKKLVKGL